jgi:hypothetical protein
LKLFSRAGSRGDRHRHGELVQPTQKNAEAKPKVSLELALFSFV